MKPQIENFLQEALKNVSPQVQGVGRVVVEPDYDSDAPLQQPEELAAEFQRLLRSQRVDLVALMSHVGFEVEDLSSFPRVASLVRRISLHSDSAEGPWIEVAPPGSWI
jgi:hypothetical protein